MSQRRGVNPWILAGGALLALPLFAVLYSGFGKDPREVPSVLVDKAAPSWKLTDLDGHEWSLAELRGTPVVLNFWATWCLPCRDEYADFQKAALANPDVKFFGVVYQDQGDKIKAHLARQTVPPTYPNLLDPGAHVAIDYGVAGVPETFFLDRSGRIVYKQVGPADEETLSVLLDRARSGA